MRSSEIYIEIVSQAREGSPRCFLRFGAKQVYVSYSYVSYRKKACSVEQDSFGGRPSTSTQEFDHVIGVHN